LYNKEIILDILAYLKLLDNYHESLALWRILNLPMSDIKTEDLMQITNYARRKALSLFEACEQINILNNIEPRTKQIITRTLELIKKHTSLTKNKSTKNILLEFLNDFNYKKYLLENNRDNDFVYINQLINKITEFENSFKDKSVKNFINLFNLELESGESGSLSKELQEGPESVKIMTIHAAKGLEFKNIFIVNLVDKRFPSINRSEQIKLPDELIKEKIPTGDIHLQEERRLFYVALTRAKTNLYLTSAEDYGGARKKKLSRFLFETNFDKTNIHQDNKITSYQEKTVLLEENKKNQPSQSMSITPHSFSFSQLKAYETCPYQYYLSFILKIPVTGKAVFSYGKTMHNTLQKLFNLIKQNNSEKKLPSLEKLLKIYEESWQDDWYENKTQKEKYKKQGEKSLIEYHKQLEKNLPQVLELEKDFSLKLDKYTIKGKIDRIDNLSENKIEIIDYKTGSAKNIKKIEKDQLLIYQMAGQEIFNWNVEKLTFYYLDNNSTVSFLGTETEIAKQKEKILNLINKINSQNFNADPSSFKCQYCDFNSICKYKI
jgi:DNA helicase-2/ATP-dependent DNA helicase PcrA